MSDSTTDPFSAPSPFETIEDFFALADEIDPKTLRPVAKGEPGMSKWDLVFTTHARGGGPFGGRDNAATALTGFLRAKRVPLEAARSMAAWWDQRYCDPPLGDRVMEDKLNRAWVRWEAGGLPDLTPDEVQGKAPDIAFMTFSEMEAYEREAGAMQWLLSNVIPEGGLVYVSAPPSGAKSWVLLDMVRAFVTGGLWLGKYEMQPASVLYIDEEMGVQKALPRLRKLGLGGDVPGMWYTNKAGVRFDNPEHVAQIMRHVEENGIKVIFVDTLTRVHRLDEDNNSQMRELFERFKPVLQAGVTLIIAHHDRKKGADSDVKHERMRGAGEIAAACDMSYAIDKVGHMFRLTTSKGRLVSEDDQIAVDFVVEDNEDRTTTTLRAIDAEERVAQRDAETEARVLAALLDGPMGTRELHGAVKGRAEAVSQAAKRLVDCGEIVSRTEGRKTLYALPGDDRILSMD